MFTLQDAGEICLSPYLLEERQREMARVADHVAEARRASGVAWSGMGPGRSTAKRSEAELQAAALSAFTQTKAYRESPRGRFLDQLKALEALGFGAEAEEARAAFARGFAALDRPADPAELGVALTALGRIACREGRAACLALSDLLCEGLRLAAE